MSPLEQFSEWRAELLAECDATEQQLSAERSKLEAAEAAHGEARVRWQDLNAFGQSGMYQGQAMAAALHARLQNSRETLTAIERARGAARAGVKNLEIQIAGLRDAIGQIGRAIEAHKVVKLPRSVESVSRKPKMVEFDNIQMPREATK